MISLQTFLEAVEKNVARVREYHLGGDGTNGLCDCIGLWIGALRLAGEKWSWTHGTNYSFRYKTNNAKEIKSNADLYLGGIVYKARDKSDPNYSMPDKYKNSGCLLDVYHTGVVTSLSPLCITHCTSVQGGIKRDNKIGKWKYIGELALVDYGNESEDKPMIEGNLVTVVAESGSSVRMRDGASSMAKVVMNVPVGAYVTLEEKVNDAWCKITYQNKTGYMMAKFLNEGEYEGDNEDETFVDIKLPRDLAIVLRKAIDDALEGA